MESGQFLIELPMETRSSKGTEHTEAALLPTVLLVDGHAFAYRSFHAIRSLSSPTGQPTNAIFGFINALTRIRDQAEPARLAVVWDGGLAPDRLALVPEYKAQRPPMPAALKPQLDGMVGWLRAAGIPSFMCDGVEADDWLAAFALAGSEAGMRVVIASSDKDFLQLVTERVGVLNPNDQDGRVWKSDDVVAKTGVSASQIVDWLSLAGDSVDNIEGVPGVGVKTAAALLRQFGTIEGILAGLDQLQPARIRESLRDHASRLDRNRRMVRLRPDLAPPVTLDQLRIQPADPARLAELYRSWGFRRLLAGVAGPGPGLRQGELF